MCCLSEFDVGCSWSSSSTIVAIYKCTRLPSLASPDFSCKFPNLEVKRVREADTLQMIPRTQSSGQCKYKNLTLTQYIRRCTNSVLVSNRVPSSSHAASPSSNPSSIFSWAAEPSTPRQMDTNITTHLDIKTTAPLERGSTDQISSLAGADKASRQREET